MTTDFKDIKPPEERGSAHPGPLAPTDLPACLAANSPPITPAPTVPASVPIPTPEYVPPGMSCSGRPGVSD